MAGNNDQIDYDKHPRDKLPHDRGTYRYAPPSSRKASFRTEKGYLDENGNEWLYRPSRTVCEHWDVEHENGEHSNIKPDGEIHHGTAWRETFP